MPTTMIRFKRYPDLDAVAKDNNVPVLDYGEPLTSPRPTRPKQPTWLDVGHQRIKSAEPGSSVSAYSSGSGSALTLQDGWKDARISELEVQLEIQTAAKEALEASNARMKLAVETHVARMKRERNENLQLRQLIQSRELLIDTYSREYIVNAQTDISVLATDLAMQRGIVLGDRTGIKTRLPSVIVSKPVVARLLKNPVFIADFLEPWKRRRAKDRDSSDDDTNEEDDPMDKAKRLRTR